METLEVYTLGSGFTLERIFNVIKMIIGSGSFRSILSSAALCTIIALAIGFVYEQNFKAMMKWFFTSTIVSCLFLGSTANIKIVDKLPDEYGRLNASRVVTNVPWGLAILAHYSSAFGDLIGKGFESVFSAAFNVSAYQRTGLIFGTKIVEDLGKINAVDKNLAAGFLYYTKECLYPDISLGHKRKNGFTMQEFANHQDLLSLFRNNSSRARPVHFTKELKELSKGKSVQMYFDNYVSCKTVGNIIADAIEADAKDQFPNIANKFFDAFYPETTNNAFRQHAFQTAVEATYRQFTDSSRNAKDLLMQNIAINSFKNSVNIMDSYASEVSKGAIENTFYQMSELAGKIMPALRSAFEVIVYGLFPIILILLFTPKSKDIFINYAMSLFALSLWVPVFTLLFSITTYHYDTGLNNVGYTLASKSKIEAYNKQISMIMGYLLMFTPIIVGWLFRGNFFGLSGLASSMYHLMTNVTTSQAEQAVKGNVSMGEVGIGNVREDTYTANKFDDNFSLRTGESSIGAGTGSVMRSYANNTSSIDMAGAVSNLGGLSNINMSSQIGSKFDQNISEATNEADRTSSDFIENSSNAYSKLLGFTQHDRSTEGTNYLWQQSLAKEERESVDQARGAVEKFAKEHGISNESAVKLFMSAKGGVSTSKALDKIPFLNAASGDASAGADASKSAALRDAYTTLTSNDLYNKWQQGQATVDNKLTSKSITEGTIQDDDFMKSVKNDFNKAKIASYQHSQAIEKLNSIQEAKGTYASDSKTINQELNNQYANWGLKKHGDKFSEYLLDTNQNRKLIDQFLEEEGYNHISSPDKLKQLNQGQTQGFTTTDPKLAAAMGLGIFNKQNQGGPNTDNSIEVQNTGNDVGEKIKNIKSQYESNKQNLNMPDNFLQNNNEDKKTNQSSSTNEDYSSDNSNNNAGGSNASNDSGGNVTNNTPTSSQGSANDSSQVIVNTGQGKTTIQEMKKPDNPVGQQNYNEFNAEMIAMKNQKSLNENNEDKKVEDPKQTGRNGDENKKEKDVVPPKQKRGDHFGAKKFKESIELAATNQTVINQNVKGGGTIKVLANNKKSELGLGKAASQRNYEVNKKITEDEANRWAVSRWFRSTFNINPRHETYAESVKYIQDEIKREEEEQKKAQETGVATNAGNNDKKGSKNNG